MELVEVLNSALEGIVVELTSFLPKLIIALLIWYAGSYLLNLLHGALAGIYKKKGEQNKAAQVVGGTAEIVGRIILVLVILDYLGIGRTIIAALTQGVTFAVAIALGLAFGKALEGDAQKIMLNLKKLFRK